MALTWSNSDLFSIPDFVVSPVGKREKGGIKKKRREGGEKGIEKERRKEEGIKKGWRQDKKEFFKN